MRILFWGTPEFAAPALRALLGEGFDVVGVVTQPDRPRGRSRSTLVPSPVKRVALAEGVPVLQPERPRGAEFVDRLRALAPDVSMVVAYGHLLIDEVIALPRLGTLNVHASLLPRWRGAAPIQAAILAGDRETGISIMRVVRALDAGPVLMQLRTPIDDEETFGELQMRLSELGALAAVQALALLDLGATVETPQDDALVSYAPKIERPMTEVDWSREAVHVARVIRAFDPRPGALTTRRGQPLKLFGARSVSLDELSPEPQPGEVVAVGAPGMVIACGRGGVRVTGIQPAGGRRLPVDEWARGRTVRSGERLGT